VLLGRGRDRVGEEDAASIFVGVNGTGGTTRVSPKEKVGTRVGAGAGEFKGTQAEKRKRRMHR
jgi:hypothetical protein